MSFLAGNEKVTFSFTWTLCSPRAARMASLHVGIRDESKPSIWKLALVKLLSALCGDEIFDLAQGLLGAPSPKPTRLLSLNLPALKKHLRAHHVTPNLPQKKCNWQSCGWVVEDLAVERISSGDEPRSSSLAFSFRE